MVKKLILLIILAMLLNGCGASAPAETQPAAGGHTPEMTSLYGGEQPGEGIVNAAPSASAQPESDPVETAGETEYFLFQMHSATITDENGVTLLYENQTVPTFVSAQPERRDWVNGILDGIGRDFAVNSSNLYQYAEEYVEVNGTDYFYSHSNYQQLGVARHDDLVVSLLCMSSLYSGGTHPNSVQTAYNLDIENQRLLRLEDVIEEGTSLKLASMVQTAVEEKFAPIDGVNSLFDDYAEVISLSMTYGSMTPYWYFNDTGLVLFYNQYELGPYAAGIIKVELPYETLYGVLREEYRPKGASPGETGDLLLRSSTAKENLIPITIEPEGETLLIGVEGRVYQVQLSEIQWLEDTPIAQELLFSALSLSENDVLEVKGGYTDDSRSFVIEFLDGQGQQKLYYISDGELTETP